MYRFSGKPNMFSVPDMPSTSALFSAYASVTGSVMLVRSIANQIIPHQLQNQFFSKFQHLFFSPLSSKTTLIIEEFDGLTPNEVYEAAELFLRTIITPSVQRLRATKVPREKNLGITMDKGEEVTDVFQGIQLNWKFISAETMRSNPVNPYAPQQKSENRSFELQFHKKHKDSVLASYLPHVLDRAKTMKEENKVVKLHTIGSNGSWEWDSINLEHPATFDTLAMDHKLKREIMEDLETFVKRREFYKRVGKAWKRGYLLYGPPGTGKSSLIAAMANYLKFDVYDMELGDIMSNMELRRYLLATANRSILVIEDIDCSVDLPNRETRVDGYNSNKLTLSGLLNFIDGLWSSCGDERIIVFTTNHKDRLDPALLRPGRMDMHIHMSYCTSEGFDVLALNYLGIHNHKKNKNNLYVEAQDWIEKSRVTPAEVAEELMKSEDAEVALGGLLAFLKRKKKEQDEKEKCKDDCQEPKRQKVESENVNVIVRTRGMRGGRGRHR